MMRASELAERLGGGLVGPGDPEVKSVSPLGDAGEGDIAFLHNAKYSKVLAKTLASCVVLREDAVPKTREFAAIIHDNPHRAMAETMELLYPEDAPAVGVHPTAVVDSSATIGADVSIGALAYIGPRCEIGDRVQISPGCKLISDVHLEADCRLYPNVTIYPKSWLGLKVIIHSGSVIGSDGFGFAPTEEGILKVRQVGEVVLEEDVEIGACCTIDRGSFTETRIGRGTKLDNMIHIGHNCRIGEHCLIAAQTGLAGSTILGNRVMVAGQVGFGGHQTIGDGCIFYAKSGINGDIAPGSRYFGYPAKDHLTKHRENVYISKLGKLFKRVKELEKKLEVNNDNTK